MGQVSSHPWSARPRSSGCGRNPEHLSGPCLSPAHRTPSLDRVAFSSLLVVAAALGGCFHGGQTAVTYADQAQAAYADALEDFFDDDCLIAEPAFDEVKRKYPYSRFAALAELRAADCKYRQGKYAEAIQSYQQFIRYRPSHEEVPYAHFQVAAANFEQTPSDWLLEPPAYERDQRFTRDALRLLRRFILDYPTHPLVTRAQELVTQSVELLANHELYVATFYLERDAPEAAVGRLRTLLRSYNGSDREPEALWLLGRTYLSLDRPAEAQAAYKELVERFPKSAQAERAREQLADMGSVARPT